MLKYCWVFISFEGTGWRFLIYGEGFGELSYGFLWYFAWLNDVSKISLGNKFICLVLCKLTH